MARTQAGQRADPSGTAHTSTGLWPYAVLAVLLAVAGVLAGAALLWLQLLAPANMTHIAHQQQLQAKLVRDNLEIRLAALQGQLEVLSRAPSTRAAVNAEDPGLRAIEASRLASLAPHVRGIRLFPKGTAAVDLDAEPPVSFAAVDLVQRAESGHRTGPEAIRVGSANLVYVAEPITGGGTVDGVLLAALGMDLFALPLAMMDVSLGSMELEQRLQNAAPITILRHGEDFTAAPIRLDLSNGYWSVLFRPAAGASAAVTPPALLSLPVGVTLVLVLAGIAAGFGLLNRALRRDLSHYLAELPALMRGRAPKDGSYRLPALRELATAAAQVGAERADTGAARATPPDPAFPANGGSQSPSRPPDDTDNFLEVRPRRDEPAREREQENFGIEVSETASALEFGLELDPLIFRAYDIRGIVAINLTDEVVYWIGRAFGAEARAEGQRKAVIGGDGRLSSPALRAALAKGIQESGVDVIDIGQVPTPVLYYATHALETGTGVMVTGSHNPPDYNGLKMMIAGETLAEKRIQRLRERIERNELTEGQGSFEEIELIRSYIDRVVEDVAIAQPLKVVVDCGNGVAGAVAPELLRALGCDVIELYCEVDGHFPNHHPDPAEPDNLEHLRARVRDEQADLGLAFDGDGDRLGVVTSSGEIVWPDRLMMLFSRDIVGRNPGADILFDVKCSRHLGALVSEYGGRPIMWKTGHSHMKAKLKETGALLAGEFSGHIFFGERWYGFDDALYSAARLLEIVGGEGQTLDELMAEFPLAVMTPELKIPTTEKDKFDIVERLARRGDFGGGTITAIDGIRVDYDDGWGLIRPSNTSPVLVLRFEADDPAALARIQSVFRQQLRGVAPSLTF
jgi:phosphomannomutase / phosphoglucomutase